MGEQLRDLDQVVEGVGAHHAGFACDGVERLHAAGERAGMRERRLPALFRLAHLQGDDVLAGGARHAAGGLEFLKLRDRLDIDGDDFQFRLIREIGDVVAGREPGLVAAGDEILRRDAALLQRGVGEDHHAAALADQRNRPFLHREHAVFGERDQAGFGADIAHAVRARHREAGFRDDRGELAAEARGFRVEAFAEARGKNGGAARARRRARAQRVGDAGGRHQHDQMIGRFRQRLEIGIAGLVPDLGAARIDRIDRAGELILVKIAPDPRGPASRSVAGADQHGVARRGERFDFLL